MTLKELKFFWDTFIYSFYFSSGILFIQKHQQSLVINALSFATAMIRMIVVLTLITNGKGK